MDSFKDKMRLADEKIQIIVVQLFQNSCKVIYTAIYFLLERISCNFSRNILASSYINEVWKIIQRASRYLSAIFRKILSFKLLRIFEFSKSIFSIPSLFWSSLDLAFLWGWIRLNTHILDETVFTYDISRLSDILNSSLVEINFHEIFSRYLPIIFLAYILTYTPILLIDYTKTGDDSLNDFETESEKIFFFKKDFLKGIVFYFHLVLIWSIRGYVLTTLGIIICRFYPLIGLLLILIGIYYAFVVALLNRPIKRICVFFLSSMLSITILGSNFIKIRSNVLGLTFLAAIIPFLNSDSWQMVNGIRPVNMLLVAFIIYFFPIFLFIFSRKNLILERFRTEMNLDTEVNKEELLSQMRTLKSSFWKPLVISDSTNQYLDLTYLNSQKLTKNDIEVISRKIIFSSILFIFILPILVFLFSLIIFQFMLSESVLIEWLKGFSMPNPLQISAPLNIYLSGLSVLRAKASILLALLSTVSTLGTLFSSEEDLSAFLENSFINDVKIDKYLLILWRCMIKR
ncbi:hypothetical protein [Sphaerothrix gracilis]|uniref:hypothetical protein n=1 Tax=Sphaerothrix gracilis TaxID=3151835 RepID=UPI0031FD5AC8